MLRRKITTSGNSAALLLSKDLLGLMGVQVGDEVDVDLIDRTLIVRPVTETERAARVAEAAEHTFRTYGDVLGRLAESDRTRKPRKARGGR